MQEPGQKVARLGKVDIEFAQNCVKDKDVGLDLGLAATGADQVVVFGAGDLVPEIYEL